MMDKDGVRRDSLRESLKVKGRSRREAAARHAEAEKGSRPCRNDILPSLQITERGTTCSEFIYSSRLHHAAHLLHRRALLGTGESLSEIGYACGFRDYAHFARRFRKRFGYSPGAHAG